MKNSGCPSMELLHITKVASGVIVTECGTLLLLRQSTLQVRLNPEVTPESLVLMLLRRPSVANLVTNVLMVSPCELGTFLVPCMESATGMLTKQFLKARATAHVKLVVTWPLGPQLGPSC